MKTVLLSLLAACNLLSGGEAYKPFDIGIGTNAYEVPGGFENTKLTELGYTQRSSGSRLDGVPVATRAHYDAWLAVYESEQIELEIIQRRPELARATLEEWAKHRRAQGAPKVFWTYHKEVPNAKRAVTLIFNGETGLVLQMEANAIAETTELVADLKNTIAAVGRGAGKSTSDGLIMVYRMQPRNPRPESKRIPADELPAFIERYLARTNAEDERLTFDNSNPPDAANPFGGKRAFGLVKCEVSGNNGNAHMGLYLYDDAPPNVDDPVRKVIEAQVLAQIAQREKELIENRKKAKPAADGF